MPFCDDRAGARHVVAIESIGWRFVDELVPGCGALGPREVYPPAPRTRDGSARPLPRQEHVITQRDPGRAAPGGTVYGTGAGLAGLAATVDLVAACRQVVLHEAERQAGGRCRSYHDASLDLTTDKGSHLLLWGNRAALAFLDRVGARAAQTKTGPEFHFSDLDA